MDTNPRTCVGRHTLPGSIIYNPGASMATLISGQFEGLRELKQKSFCFRAKKEKNKLVFVYPVNAAAPNISLYLSGCLYLSVMKG
jgi:hypothetical protein